MVTETMTLTPKKCPVCGMTTLTVYSITEPNDSEALWFHCKCGVVFQNNKPEQLDIKEPELKDSKKIQGVKTYVSVIEEITYGRKFIPLEDEVINGFLEGRGWVRCIEEGETPDLVVCEGWLEQQLDPVDELKNLYKILPTSGVIYFDTPNADTIYKGTVQFFRHWNCNENYVLWNERSLVRELERVGFDIIVKRCNATLRYRKSDTVQIIAQKPFF